MSIGSTIQKYPCHFKNHQFENLKTQLPDLPCAVVAMNLVHMKNQDNVMNVGHTILKQRWQKTEDGEWKIIGQPIRSGLHRISASAGEFKDTLEKNLGNDAVISLGHSTRKQRCMSCYGSVKDEDACCNTCESLRESFTEKGWTFPTDHIPEQCEDKLFKEFPPMENEGCKMSTRSLTRKVPAYLQIGLAYDFRKEDLHETWMEKARKGYVSFSHTIDSLSFGPKFPGFVPVLDGMERKHDHGIYFLVQM